MLLLVIYALQMHYRFLVKAFTTLCSSRKTRNDLNGYEGDIDESIAILFPLDMSETHKLPQTVLEGVFLV
jgi:hypothetical protein